MEQKEIRLNASKRKSLTNDYRRHEEAQHSQEKEDFFDSREKATEVIDSSFATMKSVVERRFKPEHIFGDRSLTFYEKEIAHAQFVVAREETSKAIDKAFKGMKSVVARRFK